MVGVCVERDVGSFCVRVSQRSSVRSVDADLLASFMMNLLCYNAVLPCPGFNPFLVAVRGFCCWAVSDDTGMDFWASRFGPYNYRAFYREVT